jgi:serine phosphatase RsbU (regulator of sigma subunit)/Flp pilus assembly protein TadD
MNIIKKYFILHLLFYQVAFTQNNLVDSLINLTKKTTIADTLKIKYYGDISWELMASDINQSLLFAEKELELATKINSKKDIAQAESDIGNVYNRKADYKNALIHYYKASELRQQLNQSTKLAGIYSNIATVLMRQNNFKDAIDINFKALKIFEQEKDTNKQGIILGNIGNIYYELEQNKEALIYFNKSLACARKVGNKTTIANVLVNIGGLKFEENDLASALFYFLEAKTIMEENNLKYNLAVVYNNIGKIYAAKNQEGKAIEYYEKSLKNRIELQDEFGIGLSNLNLGELYKNQGNYSKAIESLLISADIFKRTNALLQLKQTYGYLAETYKLKNDLSSALNYYEKYSQYKDSVYTKDASDKLVEMNTKYETEAKEKENELLLAKNKLSNETIKQQRTFSYFIITALILSAGLAFFIFRGLKQQRLANAIISEQKQEVEIKNHVIEEKQKEIIDSITYAKRIQQALLASKQMLDSSLSNYFALYKPKDIVSGDFYWATNHQGRFYLAVCDSTGHGVPGAFMSLLNIGFLSEAIKEKNISKPNEIFNYVRERLIETMSLEGQKDGFDGIIICFDIEKTQKQEELTIEYAAAHNAPLLISNHEIIELEKDKMPVGYGERKDKFKLSSITLKKDDILYLYTDGFADQFGGPKGKKYKYKKLQELLLQNHQLSMTLQKESLNNELENWKGNLEQVDDVLVFGIKI